MMNKQTAEKLMRKIAKHPGLRVIGMLGKENGYGIEVGGDFRWTFTSPEEWEAYVQQQREQETA